MSERSKESYMDSIYNSINDYLLKNTEEIIRTKTFKLVIDDIDVMNFFKHESNYLILNSRLHLGKLIENYNIPINIDDVTFLIDSTFLNQERFRDLKAKSFFKVICANSVIVGQGEIMAYLKKVNYQCDICGSSVTVNPEEDNREAVICRNCKKGRKINASRSEYGEIRTLIIREDFDESGDKQPIEYLAKIKDEFIHKFDIGNKVRFVGTRKVIINPKTTEYKIELDIISAEGLDDPKLVYLEQDEIKQFKKESKNVDKFTDDMINSFAPDVFCKKDSLLWNVKAAFLLFLIGGNNVDRKRQKLHLLLIGDPGVAKTTMMKFAVSISPKSMYVAGNATSRAGLTAIIEKQSDGKFIAKAGVLPLCDNGFAMVDEFNLMEKEDQNGLQEAMENQSVTKAKAVYAQFPARCGVVGGANPISGRYDPDMSVLENLGISPPLLSRYDMKWCLLDIVEKQKDSLITRHLLGFHSKSDKIDVEVPYDRTALTKYLNYVRTLEPELTESAKDEINNFVTRVRSLNKDQKSIPIDLRIIETTIRLCTARAKWLMKDFIEASDVKYVTDLYLKSLESFGIDTQGEITQNKFFDKDELNKVETFLKCFHDSCNDKGHADKMDVIDKMASTKWFDEWKAKSFFERMIRNGKLMELKDGSWKMVE